MNNAKFPFELIILGGSFSSLTKRYRREFFSELYNCMLNCDNFGNINRSWEKSQYRPSVVTVESRPDQIDLVECQFLREIGVSKVEIGVQHTSDHVLAANNRGHDQSAVIYATRMLKDEGFKVGYHIMLGLPDASIQDDEEMLTSVLWHPEYSPDYLKIYPCVILKDRHAQPQLHKLYESRKWFPISKRKLLYLLQALSESMPQHVRISRINRQFHPKQVMSAVNWRNWAVSEIFFSDVRNREVGRRFPEAELAQLGPIQEHITKQGNDVFVELICRDNTLLAMVRLRISGGNRLIMREIRVYGKAAPIGTVGSIQGRGLGRSLMSRVERLGVELGACTCFVNAAFGARPFFRKLGYCDMPSGLLKKNIVSSVPHQPTYDKCSGIIDKLLCRPNPGV
jgi:elongator complex protein 3